MKPNKTFFGILIIISTICTGASAEVKVQVSQLPNGHEYTASEEVDDFIAQTKAWVISASCPASEKELVVGGCYIRGKYSVDLTRSNDFKKSYEPSHANLVNSVPEFNPKTGTSSWMCYYRGIQLGEEIKAVARCK